MKLLSAAEVHARAVAALGLDEEALDLTSIEAIAAALRRAAGFLCPCAPSTLIRAVINPLQGLVNGNHQLRETVEDVLELLVSYGDLLEQSESNDGDVSQGFGIYASPPSFVWRQSGFAMIIGVAADNVLPLPEQLQKRIQHMNHVRILPANSADDLRQYLIQLGLIEVSASNWTKAPRIETARLHLTRMEGRLTSAAKSGEIPGLTIIDPARPSHFYRGRWITPSKHNGRFIGRRTRVYGADLWCFVELRAGQPEKFIDLPLPESRLRGCDEAWRLQAAIDAVNGQPQRLRVRMASPGTKIVDFFSPVPMWARRRWDAIGQPVLSVGCLFSYAFPEKEVAEELKFLDESLWLNEFEGLTTK